MSETIGQSRPEKLLAEVLSEYKKLSWYVEECIQARENNEIPGWPEDVFIPFAA